MCYVILGTIMGDNILEQDQETDDDAVTPTLAVTQACTAVVHALMPRYRAVIAGEMSWRTGDRERDAASVLAAKIVSQVDAGTTVPWWDARGVVLTQTLADRWDTDDATASHLLGAALQAHVTAGLDLQSRPILELAERAYVWMDARTRLVGTEW